MTITHAIVKVVRGCNIACKYCYIDQYGFGAKKIQLMGGDILELLFSRVAEHVRAHKLSGFTFYWHGGEPLLQPMHFYERVGELSQRYLSEIRVLHLLQTNATRLTREYARLLKELGIVVSVSLDGPPNIHDKHRVNRAGRPTSHRVLKGVEALQAEGHPTQILCVITRDAIGHGAEIYRYFRSMGTTWMDFLLPHANSRHTTILPQDMPTQEQFAEFYIDVYREWMSEGSPNICVRRLRDYVQLLLGWKPDTCIFSDDCSYIITVLPDGKVYACDDLLSTFSEPMGSLHRDTLDDIGNHSTMDKVRKNSSVMFGQECLGCDYFDVCKSGCTNFRAAQNQNFTDRYYYCRMSMIVIDYIRNDILQRLSQAGIKPKTKKDSTSSALPGVCGDRMAVKRVGSNSRGAPPP